MTKPRLRAHEWCGTTWDDPSEDRLHDLLADMNLRHCFVVVDRLDAPGPGDHYMQVHLNEDMSCLVEYRSGGPETHHRAVVTEPFGLGGCDIVAPVLQAWAFGRAGWREALPWVPWDAERDAPRADGAAGQAG
ncbi:hypothetical protein [Streptomyces sp. bgisy100]|uniref:hypothetical protein n=1 Tax=Streptomyces sp. bgisy100 TaxID=3413783 RepID=UPI003D71A123